MYVAFGSYFNGNYNEAWLCVGPTNNVLVALPGCTLVTAGLLAAAVFTEVHCFIIHSSSACDT